MTAIETVEIVEPWLYAKMTGDSALVSLVTLDGISGTLSVETLPLPYATFLNQSTRDIGVVDGGRITTDNLYMIKAVAKTGSWSDVLPIARRINALFDLPGQVITLSNGSLSCYKERTVQYPEVDEGLQYRHLGGIFRIRASAN